MDDFGGKIIGIVIGAVVIYILQSIGFHNTIANMVGGVSSISVESWLSDTKDGLEIKEETKANDELVFWQSSDKCGKTECYQAYIDKYPKGQFVAIARANLGARERGTIKKEQTTETTEQRAREIGSQVDTDKLGSNVRDCTKSPDNKKLLCKEGFTDIILANADGSRKSSFVIDCPGICWSTRVDSLFWIDNSSFRFQASGSRRLSFNNQEIEPHSTYEVLIDEFNSKRSIKKI